MLSEPEVSQLQMSLLIFTLFSIATRLNYLQERQATTRKLVLTAMSVRHYTTSDHVNCNDHSEILLCCVFCIIILK